MTICAVCYNPLSYFYMYNYFLHICLCSIYRCVLRHQFALLTSCRNEELPHGSRRIYLTPARGKGQANVWLPTLLIHKVLPVDVNPVSVIDYGVHSRLYHVAMDTQGLIGLSLM